MLVSYIHKNYICKSSEYLKISDDIIGDMLMNRVKHEEGKLKLNMNKFVYDIIEKWYKLSEEVKKYNTPITLYRGARYSKNEKIILQPIPFSTCLDYEYAKDWVFNNGFIMKINIKYKTPYTFIDNINEGDEVVLPSGYLYQIKNIQNNIIEYDFVPLSHDEMLKLHEELK
jgi:hypothetical protein